MNLSRGMKSTLLASLVVEVLAAGCTNECRRRCNVAGDVRADNMSTIPYIPLRMYHPRLERTRRRTHYLNTHIALSDVFDPSPQFNSKPTYADAMMKLHGTHDIYGGLGATREKLNLPTPEAVSPSAAPMFLRELIQKRKPRFVIEVGVFLGFTTISMAKALDELYGVGAADGSFVLSIDTWLGDAYMWALKDQVKCVSCTRTYADTLQRIHGKPAFFYQFLQNVLDAKVERRVVPFPLATNEAARVLDYLGWQPDLVYIDASHDALDVIQDLEHFYHLCLCGGVLVGDDYHWDQVAMAINWFARRRGLQLKVYEIFGFQAGGSGERSVLRHSGPAPHGQGAAAVPPFEGEQKRSGGGKIINSKWMIEKPLCPRA